MWGRSAPRPSLHRAPGEVDLAYNPDELRGKHGEWVASPENIVKRWQQATPGEKHAGEQWYPEAHKVATALSAKYGVPTEEAAGLLADYSPQTPWGRNQVTASEALRYGHGVGGPYAALWYGHDDPTVEDRVGMMATKVQRSKADRLMHGEDMDTVFAGRNKSGTVKPKAMKIRAFGHLIATGAQPDPEHPQVVIDRHAMSVAFGRRVTQEDYDRMHPASQRQYQPFVDAYVEAAKRISGMEGRTIPPEAVQAATWLTQQRLNAAEDTRVGKTRKVLGNKDWTEWENYAKKYLGMDVEDADAGVGYTNLSNIDLAYNPSELRDSHGRWTAKPNLPVFVLGGDDLGGVKKYAPDDAIKAVGKAYQWPTRDKKIGDASAADSIREQDLAQITARTWSAKNAPRYDAGHAKESDAAERFWEDYQEPGKYGQINEELREPGDQGVYTQWQPKMDRNDEFMAAMGMYQPPPAPKGSMLGEAKVRDLMEHAFADGGYTTEKPMTVYRALKSENGLNWAQTLKPGTVFTDNGMVSTTAHRKASLGWLHLEHDGTAGRQVNSNDVVMEVHVPQGTRVLGGDPQFIETMLHPDSKFKVVSSEVKEATDAVNPLGDEKIRKTKKPALYTHVVVELQP